jgi:hypothetical protein
VKLYLPMAAAAALLTTVQADARRGPVETWTVNRVTDPITGMTRCTVAALDRVGRTRFTRTGAIYPVIEMNSELGLLVGVSSGGPIRVPTGDILWRIDDRPFRTLRAVDNPVSGHDGATGVDPASSAIVQANRLAASFSATSTMTSGATAREMLAEMLAGRQLIYRQNNAAAGYGLVDSRATEVGQITRDGIVPYMLDQTFRAGLVACGISSQ